MILSMDDAKEECDICDYQSWNLRDQKAETVEIDLVVDQPVLNDPWI